MTIIDFKLPPEKPQKPPSSSSFSLGILSFAVFCVLFLGLSVFLLFSYSTILPENPSLTGNFWHPPLIILEQPSSSFSGSAFLSISGFWLSGYLVNDEAIWSPRWTRERLRRRLPQCIIIGVRKSGTRALIEFLHLHPRIRKASDEMHFFDEEQNYQKGMEWYRRNMPYSYADQITVEKSPAYFITRYVPQRIKAMNSSIALILVVRNPVKRVISDYTQSRTNRIKKGKKVVSFEEAVLLPDGSVDINYKPIRVSIYHRHLANWFKVFPREQIYVVDGDTLISDPVEELEKVETFLRLDHQIKQDHFHFNETKGFYCIRDFINPNIDRCLSKTKGRPHPDVSQNVVDKLNDFFRPHNQIFYEMIGRDFGW